MSSTTTPGPSDREKRIRRRLRDDFDHYAGRCLWIRPKEGEPKRLDLNRAQRHIHAKLEEQRARTGKVRALVLKGRQQGASTYIAARFYWRVTHLRGRKVFILTHEAQATDNLFEMVCRYHENCPSLVRPEAGKQNAKELAFPKLDSAYKVGTARNKGAGRSLTAQLFHGSEVAFWPNADSHAAGVLQAVPKAAGTEIILESTANGVGGYFHDQWRKAERGESEFIAIFVPWFWSDEYREDPPEDFALSDVEDELGESERSYAEAWGLDAAQMYWRRLKIADLGSTLFRQEYPACAAEAFQMAGVDSLITAPVVVRARKRQDIEASGPLVLGFDPAWKGKDRHALAARRGRKLLGVESRLGLDTTASAGWLLSEIRNSRARWGVPVARVFVDVTGIGAGVYDAAVAAGEGPYGSGLVIPVNFGAAPFMPDRYSPSTGEKLPAPLNRRAEIWANSRDWLEDPAGASIPDLDDLQADACGPSYHFDTATRLVLEPKEAMRRRGVKSPDLWDAVALTFAEPVTESDPSNDWMKRGGGRGKWGAA